MCTEDRGGGGRKTPQSMDYPQISGGVSMDSADILTEGVVQLRHLWTIPGCPEYSWIPLILLTDGVEELRYLWCRETPPSMDYPQMSGVSTDTLTEVIRSTCGVTWSYFTD